MKSKKALRIKKSSYLSPQEQRDILKKERQDWFTRRLEEHKKIFIKNKRTCLHCKAKGSIKLIFDYEDGINQSYYQCLKCHTKY